MIVGPSRPLAGTMYGRAFGIWIESEIALPGLRPGALPPSNSADALKLCRGNERELLAEWPAESRRLQRRYDEDGGLVVAIDHDSERGYLFRAPDVGTCLLDRGAEELCCAPGSGLDFVRYLWGQVLPFAALVRGAEVFHASAVSYRERVYAFCGPSGSGKSTIALALSARGAKFVSDDVLAVVLQAGQPHGTPGPPVAKARRSASDLLDGDVLPPLIDTTADYALHELTGRREEASRPVGALYFLHPGTRGPARFLRERSPGAERLLAAGFNFVVDSPSRLRNQLRTLAAIADRVPVVDLLMPDRPDPSVIDEIEAEIAARSRG